MPDGRRRALITGGSGFLGRRLALALKKEYEVVLAARNNKQNALAGEATGCAVLPMDVVNAASVRDAFFEIQPHVVVHAAATKFVDLAERQPMECIDVNVVGSQNVARAAIESGVEAVLGISTDKAAPPVRNTYGMTKALMERMFAALNGKTATRFGCVRYGNVAWSTGSVLSIWRRMHAQTGVIRTTGPDMTRFFFTVDEAVSLILTALGNLDLVQGRVLARRMPSSLIRDVLDVWVARKGGRWEPMEERPGERMHEFLIGEAELPYATEIALDGVPHYVITANEKVAAPLSAPLSSDSTVRLTEAEIVELIENVPPEEA